MSASDPYPPDFQEWPPERRDKYFAEAAKRFREGRRARKIGRSGALRSAETIPTAPAGSRRGGQSGDSAPLRFTGRDADGEDTSGRSGEVIPQASSPSDLEPVDWGAVNACASLDESDTDNGKRLIIHFGRDLSVAARDRHPGGDWLTWSGRHWDFAGGEAGAMLRAQRVGDKVFLEEKVLGHTSDEEQAISAGTLAKFDDSERGKEARSLAKKATKELHLRRMARKRFAVTTKNKNRIDAMQALAAPRLRQPAHAFNADPLLAVTENATLRFVVEDDPECPDPDIHRPMARLEVIPSHRREDYATGLLPCAFDANAVCPAWNKFLDRCLPDDSVQRMVRAYSALGILGMTAQKLMFHHGLGANGKSVFLTVLGRVIGQSYGVSLPKETILGQGERGAGQASPDLVRLFGKRFVRIDEMKEGEVLREDLVKRLTGGDMLVVRDLYRGYLEFSNVATPHMSGNGKPKIEGTDNGIWRRMLVVNWGVTIAEAEQRPFDALVAEILLERSGILNYLVAGALDYLTHGLVIAQGSVDATHEYRDDMDPIGSFISSCVNRKAGAKTTARSVYNAYRSWAAANALSPVFETRFGRDFHKRFEREKQASTNVYLDCDLHDVPRDPNLEHRAEHAS